LTIPKNIVFSLIREYNTSRTLKKRVLMSRIVDLVALTIIIILVIALIVFVFWYDWVVGTIVLTFSIFNIFLEEKRRRAEEKKVEEEIEKFLGNKDGKPLN
jgi:predicted ABC-type exoprotein transport system permease subunit